MQSIKLKDTEANSNYSKQILATTWMLWALYFLIVCLFILFAHHSRSVTFNYIYAAKQWLAGKDIYSTTGKGFIYFPQAAIFYIFFTKLPFLYSEILWRLLSLSVFAYAIYRFATVEFQNRLWLFFPLISVISLCIGFDTARDGQFNIVIVSCMLLTVIALAKNQWWHIAFYLIIGFALKPTMIVMLLLVTALYRPLWLKVSLLLIIAALVPFLTQSFSYVCNQYLAMMHMLHDAAYVGMSQTKWAQIFGLIGQFGYIFSSNVQEIIRIFFAGILFMLALFLKNKNSKENFCIIVFTLAASYLMLFNPRTENNDYIILAPAIGYYLATSIQRKQIFHQFILIIICVGLVGDYYFSSLFILGHHNWFSPLMGLLFLAIYLPSIWLDHRTENIRAKEEQFQFDFYQRVD